MPVLNLYIICRIIEIISIFAVSNSVPSPKYPIFRRFSQKFSIKLRSQPESKSIIGLNNTKTSEIRPDNTNSAPSENNPVNLFYGIYS
jgi:hypothetical protein